jgi:hypothetical protein
MLVFFPCLLLLACEKNDDPGVKAEKIDYRKASIELMDSIRPKLIGTWNMKEVNVKTSPYSIDVGINKDTTLKDFAVLDITSIDNYSQEFNLEHNDVTGVLKFKSKIYPVGFRMMSTPTRIVRKFGPQVFTLFEYRFPVGSHVTENEESYLWNLGLIGENYSLEISPDGKKMVWKGLNRAIKDIQFVKK